MTDFARVEVDGLPELRRHLRSVGAGYDDLKGAGLRAATIVATAANPPVLSGTLDGTVRAAGQAGGAVVRAGFARVPYAGVIHFGWPGHNIAPNPFLYEALDLRRAQVIAVYDAEVNKIARTASAA